jgi:hypothetical protein
MGYIQEQVRAKEMAKYLRRMQKGKDVEKEHKFWNTQVWFLCFFFVWFLDQNTVSLPCEYLHAHSVLKERAMSMNSIFQLFLYH